MNKLIINEKDSYTSLPKRNSAFELQLKENSKRKPYHLANKSTKKSRRREINRLLEHLGVDTYTFVSSKHPQTKTQETNNEEKWIRVIFDILASKDKKGNIDYFNVVEIVSDAGVTHHKLKKAKKEGEDLPIKKQMFCNIKTKRIKRKERISNGRRLNEDNILLVQKYYISNEISRISPNKTRVIKRRSKNRTEALVESIYYRQFTISDIFGKFSTKYPNIKISRSLFFKLKPKNCKKPSSKQDVCPICKDSKKNLKRLERCHHRNLTTEDRCSLEAFKFHEEAKLKREEDFKKELKTLKAGHSLIVMDFKANISLGGCAEEDSHLFFYAPQRTIFGLAMYFVKDDKLFKVMFTVVSPILMHDSISVKRILDELVLPHPVFNHFETEQISFWMDNAPNHFRTLETIGTFHFLSKKYQRNIKFNYFCEYHGKSECDRHFGLMSRMYTEYSATNQESINDTEMYVQMYRDKILSYGGTVINETGFVWSELKAKEEKKLNVIVKVWTYDEVEIHMKNTEAEITQRGGKKETLPSPYKKCSFLCTEKKTRQKKTFKFTYFYSFQIDSDKKKLTAKLNSADKGKVFSYEIEENQMTEYQMKIGAVLETQKKASKSIKLLNLKSNYHQNE